MDDWWPDGLALAGREHVDPAAVALYERKAAFDPERDLSVLRELGLANPSTVVDLGAGTGVFARTAAEIARRVVAVDVSPAMVETMRANLSGVEIVRAGLLTYEHNGEPADFVYTRNVLHHLPDFWKAIALERVARILRPGGVLRLRDIVYSFEPGEAHEVLDGWVARGARTAAAGWTADELSAHVRDEHSTFGWILEEMLRRTGFDVREVEYDGSKLYAAYVAVKR